MIYYDFDNHFKNLVYLLTFILFDVSSSLEMEDLGFFSCTMCLVSGNHSLGLSTA